MLPDEICLTSSSELHGSILWGKVTDVSVAWPQTATSSWGFGKPKPRLTTMFWTVYPSFGSVGDLTITDQTFIITLVIELQLGDHFDNRDDYALNF